MSIPSSLVLDLGTANTKVGWSTNGEPDSVFPTVVGRGRHKGAMRTLGLKDSYVGRQAQNLRGILSLDNPIRNGVVENWDDLETLWEYVWDKEIRSVSKSNGNVVNGDSSDGGDYRVLVSVPPLCPPKDWRRMGEILLEGSGVGGIYLANKSVLSMYGGGRTTGVCVDSGEDMTYIVPCWEGSPLPDATLILKLGGKHVTDRLLSLLAQGKYSFPDDTFLLFQKRGAKNRRQFSVASRRDVVREAKEQFCKVSQKPWNKNSNGIKVEEEVLRLPDGNIVVVGEEAYTSPELLFNPDLAKKKCSGLHELVYESVMRCDEKLRSRLLTNIMLTGGNSLLPGLSGRLQHELEKLLPKNTTVRVQAQEGRDHFTWNGGAHLCSLSSFQRLWLSKQDYQETGASNMNIHAAGNVYEDTNGSNGASDNNPPSSAPPPVPAVAAS